ncbi:hypothetical protein C0992_007545 [Termitomyces sp. T32_za158]|nr:hypothetical protein C0992_007545 [Termitomyces sp. T32_za158]
MHEPVQMVKVHELLHRFLISPEDFVAHIRNFVGEITMATVYDKNISKSEVERLVEKSERAISTIAESLNPGAMLVNSLPILRYIPAWFPGAGFQTVIAETRVLTNQLMEVPFRYVKDQMAAGIVLSSWVERLMKHYSALASETDIKSVAATVLIGGADTTVSAARTYIYAMLVNPEAQKKAQDEIDNVVGWDRLPDFSDRPNLPPSGGATFQLWG